MNLCWDEMVWVGVLVMTVGAEGREVACLETGVEPSVSREALQKVAGHLASSSAVSLAM